jgi:TetR/AcrR family transcriptional regulator of autoinduction and epiphytic fitness
MLDWIRAAQKDGALQPADPAQAYKQLECLVKGVAFWPQVALGQPKLTPAAQKKLATATVDLFLSHYGA